MHKLSTLQLSQIFFYVNILACFVKAASIAGTVFALLGYHFNKCSFNPNWARGTKPEKSNKEVLGGYSFLKRQRLQWQRDCYSSAAIDRSECKASYPNSSKIMCYNSRLWPSAWTGFLSEMPLLAEAMGMVAKGFWNASQHSCIAASAEEIQRVIVSGTWQALVHAMGEKMWLRSS